MNYVRMFLLDPEGAIERKVDVSTLRKSTYANRFQAVAKCSFELLPCYIYEHEDLIQG